MVTYDLAIAAGINMAECSASKFTNKYHTFLTRRFDRTDNGERIHFASAMTMLGYTDGHDSHTGVSYLELVEFLEANGANVDADLEELWRRIAFSICVSNTDDHLRNHGFILTQKGWILSPAYDINPNEDGAGLSLNITDSDNSLDFDIAMEVHEFFRLKESDAIDILKEIKNSVRNWRRLAEKYSISKTDQELKAKAFSLSES